MDNGTTGDSRATVSDAGIASFVFNGSVVTVHDGKARLTLVAGGASGYLRTGEIHAAAVRSRDHAGAELRAHSFAACLRSTPLRIFTPTMIATPLDIGGATRDITAGLDMNDSLCVLATQRRDSTGAAIHRRGNDRSAERRILSVGGKFGAGRGHAGKLRVHADARAVVAAAADSGDGSYVARSAERGAVSVGSGADAAHRTAPPSETAAKAPAPEPNVQLRVLAGANDVASDFAGAEGYGSASARCFHAGVQDHSAAAGVFGVVIADTAGGSANGAVLLVRTVHVEPEYRIYGACGSAAYGDGGAEE